MDITAVPVGVGEKKKYATTKTVVEQFTIEQIDYEIAQFQEAISNFQARLAELISKKESAIALEIKPAEEELIP